MRANHKLIAFMALLCLFAVVVILAAAFAHDEQTLRLLDAAVVGLVGVVGGAGQAIFRAAPGETLPPSLPPNVPAAPPVPERPSWEA